MLACHANESIMMQEEYKVRLDVFEAADLLLYLIKRTSWIFTTSRLSGLRRSMSSIWN